MTSALSISSGSEPVRVSGAPRLPNDLRCACRLVTLDGVIHDLRPTDALFHAARINVGALGVITEAMLAPMPAFRLRAVEGPEPLASIQGDLEGFVASADYVEFFWLP